MKSLKTLITLRQRELDEKRRQLVQLEAELERLQAEEARLRHELQEEMRLAAEHPEMAQYFGGYAKGNETQQEQARQKQQLIQQGIEKQRDIITDAFRELKQLEIAKQNADEKAEANAKRKEAIAMDEIGLQRHLSKDELK